MASVVSERPVRPSNSPAARPSSGVTAYEHGHKSPRLDTAARILAEAGFSLALEPSVDYHEIRTRHHRAASIPDVLRRLPRDVPARRASSSLVCPARQRPLLPMPSIITTRRRIAIRDTFSLVNRAVSVRLDDEVQGALRALEASGLTRSQAIRKSILDAAGALRRNEALRAEVAALEADEEDCREMADVASLMESLRAEG